MLIKQVFPESLAVPSTYCKYFYRGEQSTGDVENKVSTGALAVKNAGFLDAALWATPGYMAVGGGTGNFCTVAASTHDATLNGYSLIVTARIKKAAAAFPAAQHRTVQGAAFLDPAQQAGQADAGVLGRAARPAAFVFLGDHVQPRGDGIGNPLRIGIDPARLSSEAGHA